ncbi:MAG: AI-2E family transporter [Bacillaceae bacterium]
MEEAQRKRWLYRLLVALLILIVLYAFLLVKPFWYPIYKVILIVLGPFLFSYFIAYLLHPVVERLHRWGVYRPIAILLLYLFFFGGIGYGLYKGMPILIEQLKELSDNLPRFVSLYEGTIAKVQNGTAGMPSFIIEGMDNFFMEMENWLQRLIERLVDIMTTIVSSLLLFIIIPFLVFYISKDFKQINQFIYELFPKKYRDTLRTFVLAIDESLGRYIRGQLIVMLVLMIAASIVFFFIDLKYSLVLGILIGATDIIPYFGPIIGAIPALVIAMTMSTSMVVKTLVAIVILQFVESNVLSPYIVGKSLHIHPIVIILAILAGGEIGGMAGLLLAVPMIAIGRVFLINLKKHYRKS